MIAAAVEGALLVGLLFATSAIANWRTDRAYWRRFGEALRDIDGRNQDVQW